MNLMLDQIESAIREAVSLLPRQGPITKFAFLNPLQGLENLPYDEVMRKVGALYGNEAYLDDDRYRQKLWRGRITESDLRDVLAEDLGPRADESVVGLTPRKELRLAMLVHPLHFGQRRELDWVLAETDSLQQFRPEVASETKQRLVEQHRRWILDTRQPSAIETIAELLGWSEREREHAQVASEFIERSVPFHCWETVYLRSLWRVIRQGVDDGRGRKVSDFMSSGSTNPKFQEFEEETTSRECMSNFLSTTSDRRVDELMIRFTAAYLDQGYAATPLPGIEHGYWDSFRLLYSRFSLLAPRWRRSLAKELKAIEQAGYSPLETIRESLEKLKVSEQQLVNFISAALLSLRGFAGMIWQTENRPDLFRKASPPGTLIEFLAVRLLLLRIAREHPGSMNHAQADTMRQIGENQNRDHADAEQLAFLLFELAQVLQWTPQALIGLSDQQWRELIKELSDFGDHQRRRIFHAAFERKLAKMALQTFAIRAQSPSIRPKTPSLQVVCCIDAREESLRRHLEELDPSVETFGIAGFFGVAMYYRGAGDADFSALCPIIMKPKHWVIEEAVYSLEQSDRTRARARRFWGTAQRRFQAGSRGWLSGAIMSTLVGPLATIPMLSRILLPRATAMMNHTARQFVAPPKITRLRLERLPANSPAPPTMNFSDVSNPEESVNDEGIGFTLDEMTRLAETALRDIGLISNFAPLIILLGHGSGCINNPHESAYHCGACAGNAGGPNARALAMMLNDPRVRRNLAQVGLEIPEDTQFIGGQHNTATEEMMFFDMELLPTRKIKQVRAAGRILAEAAKRNAHERCRRFDSADLDLSNNEALLHVQDRSEDLAQTRPEYGNGSNAICFVGRRERIRGLYLDRRAFLMSYDASQDSVDSPILARILSAVVPVCEGINMLYTLSAIDPSGWGSGTKLPHNITSLVGVMDGAASDLRPGLPWQGVDIHEPVRLLFIIEATPQSVLKIMAENRTIDHIFRNHWAHVATLDPQTGQVYRFSKNRFVPYQPDHSEFATVDLPTAERSLDWYRGRREHLPFAIIKPQENVAINVAQGSQFVTDFPHASSSHSREVSP